MATATQQVSEPGPSTHTQATELPSFTRAKTVEDQKHESVGVSALLPSLRRQHSFPHTLRPVPILEGEGGPKPYYSDVLLGMGFNQSEIDSALGELEKDKGIEDIVEYIVAKREGKKPETKTETETPGRPSVSEHGEGLLLLSSETEEEKDWKCRFCAGYVNTSNTEVCIQCNRSRALCEELSDEQKALETEAEEKKKRDAAELAEMYKKQQEELERLEEGPWPCRFCDQINSNVVIDCRGCGSMKYLSRVLYTNEEWIYRLKNLDEESKKASAEETKYREEWEKLKSAGGTIECLICFDDVPVKDMVFAECKHNFCTTCWGGYLESKVNDGDVLKLNCPAPKCRRAVDKKEIKARLSPAMYDKFNKFYTQAQLSLNPNARWCPTPDCEGVMFGSRLNPRLECPKCHHEICFRCNHDWHTGSCERAARGAVGFAADRVAYAAWAMVANIKPCPQCRSPIEKNEGCNHMTCQRCKYQFCWMCRGEYGSNHYAWWNLWGCPGGQFAGCLTCLGDDRCFCIDLGCGCGLFGKLKRTVLKIMALGCAAACCPCLFCYGMYQCFCD